METKIIKIFKSATKVDNVSAQSLLREDLGFSSIRFMSFLEELCESLKIDLFQLSQEDLQNSRTVGDIIEVFKKA
jgi:acyl carrier protein